MNNQAENNVRKHGKSNQQCQIQKHWQHREQNIERKKKQHTTQQIKLMSNMDPSPPPPPPQTGGGAMAATLDFVRCNRTQFWKTPSGEYHIQD